MMCREACRSILTFFQDVLDLPTTFTGKHYRSAVDAVFLPRGATLTRVLVAALAGALPESRLSEVSFTFLLYIFRLTASCIMSSQQQRCNVVKWCLQVQYVLLALARLYSTQLVQWAQEAATLIPSNVVTEGERISFLQAIQSAASGGTDSSSLTNSMEEMSEVCRRNKKGHGSRPKCSATV